MRRQFNDSPISLFSFQDIITATTGILILLAMILALSIVGAKKRENTPQPELDIVALQQELEQIEQAISQYRELLRKSQQRANKIASLSPEEAENQRVTLEHLLTGLQSQLDTLDNQAQREQQKSNDLGISSKIEDRKKELAQLEVALKSIREQIEKIQRDNHVYFNFRDVTSPPTIVEITSDKLTMIDMGQSSGAQQQFRSIDELLDFIDRSGQSDSYFVLAIKPDGITNYAQLRLELEHRDADLGVILVPENETIRKQ